MQRRSPEARFEMNRTKMPSPDTTKSVCNDSSKEFRIFFQTLFSLSSMASKVFLKTQFQEGSFRSPLAATSIVENIFYGIRDKTTDNPGFFCCNLVVLIDLPPDSLNYPSQIISTHLIQILPFKESLFYIISPAFQLITKN